MFVCYNFKLFSTPIFVQPELPVNLRVFPSLGECGTLWSEPERVHVQNVEQLHTHDLRWREGNVMQPCNNWRRSLRFTALECPSRRYRGHP